MDDRELKAIEILQTLDACKKVSRWECLTFKRELKILTQTNKFNHLSIQVEDLIESAKESI